MKVFICLDFHFPIYISNVCHQLKVQCLQFVKFFGINNRVIIYRVKLLETAYKNHFEFIVILCPTILDNKMYLSRKWIFDDKNVFIVCDVEEKLNEWIRLFKGMLKGHQTLFIIDDCSAEGEIN